MSSTEILYLLLGLLIAVGLYLGLSWLAARAIMRRTVLAPLPVQPVSINGKAAPLFTWIKLMFISLAQGVKKIAALPAKLRLDENKQALELQPDAPQTIEEFDYAQPAWIRPEALLVLSGIFLVLLSQWLRTDWVNRSAGSFICLVTGIFLFIIGGATVQTGKMPAKFQAVLLWVARRLRVRIDQVIILLDSLMLTILATAAAGFNPIMLRRELGLIAWAAAIVMVVLGSWKPENGLGKVNWRPVLWAVGLTLIALPFRLILIDKIPVNLTGDEASSGLSALEFLTGKMNNLFTIGWFSFPSFFYFLQSQSIAVFGQTTLGIRFLSTVAGSMTVGAVYLLGRTLFNHRTGLYSAILLIPLHFHIHFSRIGLNNVWDGLLFVVAVGSFWHGWKTGRRAGYLIAGLVTGLGQYFYTSGRLLIPFILALLFVLAIADWKHMRRALPHVVLMFFSMMIVFLPLAWFFINNPNEFMAPMERVSVLGDWMKREIQYTQLHPAVILSKQIIAGLKAYTDTPLRMWYDPQVPILRKLPGVLFYLGMGLLALRWKDARTWLIVIWLIEFGFTGGLSESTPAAQRYIAAAPVAVLVVGFGLAELSTLIGKIFPGTRWLRAAALAGILIFVIYDDANFYFNNYTPRSNFGGDNTLVAQRLANYLQAKPGEWHVYFYGMPRMGYYSISTLPYLAPNAVGFDCNEPWGSPGNPVAEGDNIIFLFLPNHEEELTKAMAKYPGGKLIREITPTRTDLYWLYELDNIPPPQDYE